MPQSLPIIVCDSDRTRKAQIYLPSDIKIERLIQKIKEQWNLSDDVDYGVRLERTEQQLDPSIIVMELSLQENDVLSIYPMPRGGIS